ncbi:putative S-adenosyl-L-methionine-dependent methyltransferase [Rosa chinensis]|uniref:Putative S-adenosyl-L-methionine-dependent methyltransferase n=1 Tax=Rosa chinensis TaxID=74649 RepID=A0A2P6PSI3_ROSCH|nr:putative S-adenosyl-L-methionine-dependent methyltransferase [Rosa chinensis]PRQ24874.1 putative S-adenosyl-L-methionine-dependent methyltransferase [Rosa chinensis]
MGTSLRHFSTTVFWILWAQTIVVAEISRVLRPGGVFVATTYILDVGFLWRSP